MNDKQRQLFEQLTPLQQRVCTNHLEGEDQRSLLSVGKDGGKPQQDHMLTVDCAKQLEVKGTFVSYSSDDYQDAEQRLKEMGLD